MELVAFRVLLSPSGQLALRDATALAPTEAGFLVCFEKLRKRHPVVLAKAALETVLLREKARVKFADADRMYFTRESLEQASGEIAARHRATRLMPYATVADLCCGIGADALALAGTGLRVHAVECDPLRAAMTTENARVLGFAERLRVHVGDALSVPLPEARAAFADPSRRCDGRRHLAPEDYSPPLSALRGRFAPDFPLGVKIAPGVSLGDVGELGAEVEFVSVHGELKECVLWFGALRTAGWRATVLPIGATLSSDDPPDLVAGATPAGFIFDPDPAVVRAGLAGLLAEQLGARSLDPVVALFTGSERVTSPFVTAYRVHLAERYHLRRLNEAQRHRRVGRVTMLQRGSRLDAEMVRKQLKLEGDNHCWLMLTRVGGDTWTILCERCADLD